MPRWTRARALLSGLLGVFIVSSASLAAQPFVEIENGAGTQSFKVSDQAPSAPLSPEPTSLCTNQCVLVATSGANPSGTEHIAKAVLVFGP